MDSITHGKIPYIYILIVIQAIITTYFIVNQLRGWAYRRQYCNSLNWILLGHDDIQTLYATTPLLINLPIHRYYTLPEFKLHIQAIENYLLQLPTFTFELPQENYLQNDVQINTVFLNGTGKTTKNKILKGISFDFKQIPLIKYASIKTSYKLGNNQWQLKIKYINQYNSNLFTKLQPSIKPTSNFPYILLPINLILVYFSIKQKPILLIITFFGFISFVYWFLYQSIITLGLYLMSLWFIIGYRGGWRKKVDLIFRWAISILPAYVAFSVLAFCLFSSTSGQFNSLTNSFLSLFYVSYYNQSYQLIYKTSTKLSQLFFVIFQIVFTYGVFGSLLVGMFCSQVWDRREQEIKLDIIKNMIITCQECGYKYSYRGNLKKYFPILQAELQKGKDKIIHRQYQQIIQSSKIQNNRNMQINKQKIIQKLKHYEAYILNTPIKAQILQELELKYQAIYMKYKQNLIQSYS